MPSTSYYLRGESRGYAAKPIAPLRHDCDRSVGSISARALSRGRRNHASIPQWAYRLGSAGLIRAAGRTLLVAGLALDAVNIFTAGPCGRGEAIGGAVGGLAGAAIGSEF